MVLNDLLFTVTVTADRVDRSLETCVCLTSRNEGTDVCRSWDSCLHLVFLEGFLEVCTSNDRSPREMMLWLLADMFKIFD